jgi:hypothetical protein
VGLIYRELKPEEFHLAPREVPGSDVYTAQNSRILAAINEQGEVVATWTMFGMIHIEPFWVREDYRKSMTVMRRMAEHMKKMLKDSNIGCCYSVVMDSTPVLRKFAEWFGGKKVDGTLYYWVDSKE